MLDLFANITFIYLIYLVYGAAFLFLGVSIASKNMRGSDLKLANSLWLLGMFGFLHGIHEWLDLGPLIEGEHLSFMQIFAARTAAAVVVLLSFVFLLQFGVSLIRSLDVKGTRWVRAAPAALFLIWFLYLWNYALHREKGFSIDLQYVRHAAIAARYTFGFVGGLATACGLILYSREVRPMGRSVSQNLRFAGVTFIFYAFFAGIFSSYSTMPLVPVPVEVFRGVSAFFITYFIIKALNIFDIETRRKIEQQMRRVVQVEKLSSLGQLAAGISHEINNPLTNASLGVQALKEKWNSSAERAEREKLDSIERNIDKASAIARELLQFSRQKETEFVPCDIDRVLKGALTLLQYKLGNIIVHYSSGAVPPVMGDPVKLEQVFINILSNAVEAMPEGGEITLAAAPKGGVVQVQITDTGAGIPREHLPRVFDPFFTTKEIGVGTGLGLSLCYGIIRQHRGTIEIASEPGEGTAVTVRVPTKERYEELSEKDIDR